MASQFVAPWTAHVPCVAELRLSNVRKEHSRFANARGATVKGEVIVEVYRKEYLRALLLTHQMPG